MITTFEQYEQEAARTATHNFYLTQPTECLHGAIGIMTEAVELKEALMSPHFDKVNIIEEIGDALWYLALCSRYFNFPLQREFSASADLGISNGKNLHSRLVDLLDDLLINAGALLDFVKKSLFYNKPTSYADISEKLSACAILLTLMSNTLEIDVYQVMQINIDKLKKRFPEKFTNDLAQVRDSNKERLSLVAGCGKNLTNS